VIDLLVAGLRANSCTVAGPIDVDDARGAVIERASRHLLVACNGDVPIPGVVDGLRERGVEVLTPDDPQWSARLVEADMGITGSRVAVAQPAAIALAAAPGAPRATSLVPPVHMCIVRVDDLMPTLADAMQEIASGEMPSALTWIGGPSRTGDLEMITTLGVHGPRSVDVVLVA